MVGIKNLAQLIRSPATLLHQPYNLLLPILTLLANGPILQRTILPCMLVGLLVPVVIVQSPYLLLLERVALVVEVHLLLPQLLLMNLVPHSHRLPILHFMVFVLLISALMLMAAL